MIPSFFFRLALLSLSALAAIPAGAEDRFKIDVPYTESRVLEGDRYVIYTHPTNGYDDNEGVRTGVEKLNAWSKKASVPQILLFSGNPNSPGYYFGSKDVDLTVASGAGQHQLQFPSATEFVMAGGNFGLCFCESLRDVIRGTSRPVRITLVTDAIYDNSPSIHESADNDTAPSLARLPRSGSVSLEAVRQQTSTTAFLKLLVSRISQNGSLCPFQGQPLDLSDLELEIRLGATKTTLGSGGRKIILDLIRTRDLQAQPSGPAQQNTAATAL